MAKPKLGNNNLSPIDTKEEIDNLVQVENLRKHFPVQSGLIANLLNRGTFQR